MSYRLATIVTDAPLDFDPEANRRRPAKPELRDVFLRLEFAKLIEKMGLDSREAPPPEEEEAVVGTCESEIVTDWARAEALLELFRQRDHVACLVLPDLQGVCVEWGDDQAGAGPPCSCPLDWRTTTASSGPSSPRGSRRCPTR